MSPDPTAPQMPMAVNALKRSTPPPLPQLSMPPGAGAPAPSLPMPPVGAAPAMPMPPTGAPPAAPAPMAPAPPPWQVALQDDGSSVYQMPPLVPGGKPIVLGVNKPPKLSAAMQPKPPTPAQ